MGYAAIIGAVASVVGASVSTVSAVNQNRAAGQAATAAKGEADAQTKQAGVTDATEQNQMGAAQAQTGQWQNLQRMRSALAVGQGAAPPLK